MSSPVRYHVRRQEWTPPNKSGVRRMLPEKWTTVATFPKAADAHAECAKLLADARRTLNPFTLGGPNLFYQTSLPAYALHDYLLDHALTPPPTATTSNPNYVFWWVKNNRTFTDEQRAVVWTACDKLKLFDVVEEDDRAAAWLVVENEWLEQRRESHLIDRGEETYYRVQVAERFTIREAHRTRREAERAKDRLANELRAASEDDSLPYFDTEGQSYDWETAPFFGIRKVPAVGELTRESAYLVAGRRYHTEPAIRQLQVWEQLGYGDERELSFAAGDGETADQRATELSRRARRTVNPFAVGGVSLLRPPLSTHAITDNESDELPNGLTVDDAFNALHRLDTTPPPPEDNELLADWYDQVVQWSPEFIDVIWGTFADFRLFEVIEVPFG